MSLIDEEPYTLTPRGAKFVSEIEAQWDALQARREKLDQERRRIAAIDPLKFTDADRKAQQALAGEERSILQGEIPVLRRVLDEWPGIRHNERWAAHDRAVKADDDATAAVVKELERIGFDVANNPLAYQAAAMLIPQHPKVHAAREQAATLFNLKHMRPPMDALQERIDKAEARLRALIAAA